MGVLQIFLKLRTNDPSGGTWTFSTRFVEEVFCKIPSREEQHATQATSNSSW